MSAISVKNISKKYELGLIGSGSLRETISNKFKRKNPDDVSGVFWALKNINFEVPIGQTLGIIGHNGAGKSTLLKVISKITEPTTGRIKFKGRVASLLEVGTGFHPELTGRENIFLNGAILGMSKAEIKRKFDEIVDFSGVEKFLDTPVKRYSSGMYVRLAFSVAAHLEPEILLVDEVLSVGDYEFQKKCLGKMNKVADGGRTVLFVSHNMAAVQQLTNRCLLIDKGKLLLDSKPSEVIDKYMEVGNSGVNLAAEDIESKSEDVNVKSLKFLSKDILVGFNKTLLFEIDISFKKSFQSLMINTVVYNTVGARILTAKVELIDMKKGNQKIVLKLSDHHLTPGNYSFSFFMGKAGEVFIWEENLLNFEISDREIDFPLIIPHLNAKERDKIGTFHEYKYESTIY